MQDKILLQRIANADETALQALYQEYYPRLSRFLSRLGKDQRLADEVINDVFLVIWRSAHTFRGKSSVSTWIMGIAYNKMLKALQREQKHKLAVVHETQCLAEQPLELASAIQRLPEVQGAVVVLTYEFGYSYKEISAILDCPENTVKTRMFNARKALKSMLEV